MSKNEIEETQAFWDQTAQDWEIQVGDEGDSNRILNSDPVLWNFVGNVAGLNVLDAGCGTGYLSQQLHAKGAKVIGVDFSEKMIQIAKEKSPDIDFRVESCSELTSIPDRSIDIVVSNYVLMDVPDLEGTMQAFSRVLKAGGVAVLVFSHPCFPQGYAVSSDDGITVQYKWDFSYFERRKCTCPPWAHFTSDFIWFHRPLSDYWKAFKAAGFSVVDFEEPRLTEERSHLAENERKLNRSKNLPFSIAFKLQKK
jgi:ubiquinone/menaquinone biosynthesis C-methylase UbiE